MSEQPMSPPPTPTPEGEPRNQKLEQSHEQQHEQQVQAQCITPETTNPPPLQTMGPMTSLSPNNITNAITNAKTTASTASSVDIQPFTTTTTTTSTTTANHDDLHVIDDTYNNKDHVQLLMNLLEKLDPAKNGLASVTNEITSPTLTTRLKAIFNINRLIDHSNDLANSFIEIGSDAHQKFQEGTNKFRDWILDNQIIEHIFGPNCHVEIIKQSHTILNFVAYKLDNKHINVIWSASSLKHCGRHVLDLLTSLIRFMRTGPVLHLYWIVKTLNIEEHSEYTLQLTSHILRYIWAHSPCINQIQLCALERERQNLHQDCSEQEANEMELQRQNLQLLFKKKKSSSKQFQQQYDHYQQLHQHNRHAQHSNLNSQHHIQQQQQQQLQPHNSFSLKKQAISQQPPSIRLIKRESETKTTNTNPTDSKLTTKTTSVTTTTTSSSSSSTSTTPATTTKAASTYVSLDADEKFPLSYTRHIGNADDASAKLGSQSESETSESEYDPDLLEETQLNNALQAERTKVFLQQWSREQQICPSLGDTTAARNADDNHLPAEDAKSRAVDLILRSFTGKDGDQALSNLVGQSTEQHQSQQQPPRTSGSPDQPGKSDRSQGENILGWYSFSDDEFPDNTSDADACCSEDKNMADFDDISGIWEGDFEDSNNMDSLRHNEFDMRDVDDLDNAPEQISSAPQSAQQDPIKTGDTKAPTTAEEFNAVRVGPNSMANSATTTASATNQPMESDDMEQLTNPGSIDHFMELKKASSHLSSITNQICSDDDLRDLSQYNLANLSEPGKSLLWDLLQDDKIEYLATNLHIEVENALINLVMSFGDRYIRYKFIEACLENLSVGSSVIISLRLLPRLMSFNALTRNLSIPAVNETYAIVMWAELEHKMSQKFFKNLVDYYHQRKRNSISSSSSLLLNQPASDAIDQKQESAQNNSSYSIREEEERRVEIENTSPIFTHIDKIITRMSFLTFIYSKPFSPNSMKLNQDQMDQLWDCLTSDSNPRCSDVLFQWIYQQAVGDDFHGVDDELLDYVLKSKLPTLPAEHFRLRGLKLLEQLLWIRQDFECCHGLDHPATKLLWDIALRAVDDEVSMAAIRILNHFYIYTTHQKPATCEKGPNFMKNSMNHLQLSLTALKAAKDLKTTSQSLDIMQKVILLIRTHLEVFKAHWSYYLRILQLNNEAELISHRLSAYEIKMPMIIRLVVQAASTMDKTIIEVQANDFVGELRAEIVKWWYSQVSRSFYEQSSTSAFSPASSSSATTSSSCSNNQRDDKDNRQTVARNGGQFNRRPLIKNSFSQLDNFTVFLLSNHHSLRLLSHNQEIPFDWDERQISELDFKDMQVIYVLNDVKVTAVDSTDDLASEKSDGANSTTQFPMPTTIPSIILQDEKYFENLMEVDQILGSFQSDNFDLMNRAKALSRRVWEIIQILPTCLHYKEDLKRCGSDNDGDWSLKTDRCLNLLSAEYPQRLLYSLQIIDILKLSPEMPFWAERFLRKGGLADLYDVFMSQKLLPQDNEDWSEWLQECLAHLLKLLFQFGTRTIQSPNITDCSSSSSSSRVSLGQLTSLNRSSVGGTPGLMNVAAASTRRARRNRANRSFVGPVEERVLIPLFTEELLKLLADTDIIFDKLIRILKSSAVCRSKNDQYYYVSMSSRAMIVHHVMNFLASWCKSDPKFPEFNVNEHEQLLKALVLDDTDASTRREACTGFFKLHYAYTTRSFETTTTCSTEASQQANTTSGSSPDKSSELHAEPSRQTPSSTFSADLLAILVSFLPIAESMKPPRPLRNCLSEVDYLTELNSPGCKDYFWLTCRLIDAPGTCNQAQINDEQNSSMVRGKRKMVDLFDLCENLVVAIRRRKTFETRDFSVEDDALRGMLMMLVMALRRDSAFRYTLTAHQLIHELYGYLFAPPTEEHRHLPKCKSPATRSTAFDLMISLVERCRSNYLYLLNQLLTDQHQAVVKGSYPTDYWPHDDCRSDVGFVGLINLGATCYLATCMQHLFMIPDLRYAVLSLEDTKNIRHGEIIRELQKIFAYMLESERKAYNPRNFCKVYTMDNHPLNIAEQTDMTEFLTDLITKLEESSPGLRHIIKSLFSGTLSNNVVSLDCPHISRTTEEFYTLRVQVADMRNLNDSLDELTVKDTLEGDNMYTCSTCEKKVRAEKRACIVKLPRILCFNTMRYTFNMATMTKEKVNTHFSFPLRLNMADYLEENLMSKTQQSGSSSASTSSPCTSPPKEDESCRNSQKQAGDGCDSSKRPKENSSSCSTSPSTTRSRCDSLNGAGDDQDSDTMYELIGVTVHTGNADGGHYYCFIRDCEDQLSDKPRWYLFNDAEVKPFDDGMLGTECFGGELTTKSYDAINDRFMDFSIEKTNSAYMLFYKRVDYKYRSKSVALRYLESDTERNQPVVDHFNLMGERRQPQDCPTGVLGESDRSVSPLSRMDVDQEGEDNGQGNPIGTDNNVSDQIHTNKRHQLNIEEVDFSKLCEMTYNDFKLPRHLANWIWNDNFKFARDKYIFEHNYFSFMWQICANIMRTLNQQQPSDNMDDLTGTTDEREITDDTIVIATVHLAITFVLGVLMNSRERPNLSNWTELIRKQFNTSKAACDWLMQLIDDEETWLKQMLSKCPIEMVRQLFQRLCNDLTGSKQHKKLRLVK